MNKLKNNILDQINISNQEFIPKVSLSQTEFEFTDVYYKILEEKTFVITNTGRSIAEFHFIVDKQFPWISFSQVSGQISPGQSLDIVLRVLFKEKEAQIANYTGRNKLSSIKVRVLNGQEAFITIRTEFKGSCFGCNFQDLAKILGPISKLSSCVKESSEQTEATTEVPKEFFRIMDFIQTHPIDNLFEKTGKLEVIQEIRLALDKFEEFSDRVDSNSMMCVLIEMLESMPSPLIKPQILDEVINECKISSAVTKANLNGMNHEFGFAFRSADLIRRALYSKINKIESKTFQYLLTFFQSLINRNPKLLEDIVELFMYPIFHLKTTSNKETITNKYLKKYFITMIIN